MKWRRSSARLVSKRRKRASRLRQAHIRGQKTRKRLSSQRECGREAVTSFLACFCFCQALAQRYGQQAPEPHLLPSGARIFYYTFLALKRKGLAVDLDLFAGVWPHPVTDAFVTTAPKIAQGLACYYPAAVRLRTTPLSEGAKLLTVGEGRIGAADAWKAPMTILRPQEEACPSSSFQQGGVIPTSEKLFGAALRQFFATRLPVSPVAHPQDACSIAIKSLKKQLAQEAASVDQVPPDERYLYEEPLATWLEHLIQKHSWVKRAFEDSYQPDR